MSARKVMLLGDIGVGKSSIVQRLVFDRFDTTYKPTIGVDIYRYDVPPSDNGNDGMSFIVWDTDGNFGNAIFRHVYIRDAAAAMIVADLSRPETFETAASLYEGFKEALPGRQATILLNKVDLVEGQDCGPLPAPLDRAGVTLLRTSAKSGTHVQKAFHDTAVAIQRRLA